MLQLNMSRDGVSTCRVAVRRWQCYCPAHCCLCRVSAPDHRRARAVSAHSTCGLTRLDRTWPSNTGSPPARKHTHTQTQAHTTENVEGTDRQVNTCRVQHKQTQTQRWYWWTKPVWKPTAGCSDLSTMLMFWYHLWWYQKWSSLFHSYLILYALAT